MSYKDARKPQIFWYHGYSLGIGGWVETREGVSSIPTLTPGALSVAGGETTVISPAWKHEAGFFSISVDSAETRLWTEETKNAWITNVRTTLTGFNLCKRVTARTIVSHLISTHPKKSERKKPRKDCARICFGESGIEGLAIDGRSISFKADNVLDDEFATYGDLQALVKGKKTPTPGKKGLDAKGCKAWAKSFPERNLLAKRRGDRPYVKDLVDTFTSSDVIRCSIADSEIPDLGEKHLHPRGYSVEIDDFGRVFFGEMIVSDGMKRLNMVRWNLGCDACGDGTGGTADVNGTPMP